MDPPKKGSMQAEPVFPAVVRSLRILRGAAVLGALALAAAAAAPLL